MFMCLALPRRKIMKLNLLFMVIDLLTLLAYPILFVHGKLCQLSMSKENMALANLQITGSVTAGG